MSRYEEFMAISPIRSLHSGLYTDMRDKSKPLAQAFKKTKVDDSPERMERIKKMLQKSETGRETLDFLKEKKSKLIFEKMDYYGYFSPEHNVVALNPAHSDEDIAITFVHEVRHARQDSIMSNLNSEMTPAMMFKNGFMIEADACATECVFAHELKQKGDSSIFDAHQKTGYAPMTTAFQEEFDKSHDINSARNAAFLKWYDLPVRPKYANSFIDFMGQISKKGGKTDFQNDMDMKKMAQKLCIDSKGECFLKNPKILEAPEKMCINEKQFAKMFVAVKQFMKKFNRSAEKLGLNQIYVKHPDGSHTKYMEEAKKANARNNKLVNLQKSNSR